MSNVKIPRCKIELSENDIDLILEYLTGIHVSLYGEDHPDTLLVSRLQLEQKRFDIIRCEKELQEQEI